MFLGSALVERRNQLGNLLELNLLTDSIITKLVCLPHILYSLLQVVAGQPSREGRIEEVEHLELRHILEAQHIRE